MNLRSRTITYLAIFKYSLDVIDRKTGTQKVGILNIRTWTFNKGVEKKCFFINSYSFKFAKLHPKLYNYWVKTFNEEKAQCLYWSSYSVLISKIHVYYLFLANAENILYML